MPSDHAPRPAADEDRRAQQAQAFVEAFAEGWRAPRDGDAFADHFLPWLHDDYHGTLPLTRPCQGLDAFRADFARPLFDLCRSARGTVVDWTRRGDTVVVELHVDAVIGRSPVSLLVCDRFHLRDGRAASRVTYLDVTPLVLAVLRNPSVWSRVARWQLRGLRRRPQRPAPARIVTSGE